MSKITKIDWPGYPVTVFLAAGRPAMEEIRQYILDSGCSTDCVKHLSAVSQYYEQTDLLGCQFKALIRFDKEVPDLTSVVHEAFHALVMVMPLLGIPWRVSTDIEEVYAYALDALVGAIVKATQ